MGIFSSDFSIRLGWFNPCDLETSKLVEALTPLPSIVFEEVGSIRMMEGVARASATEGASLRFEQSVDLPPYANQATVFLNGWEAAFEDTDHHVYDVAAILARIRVTPGKTIEWTVIGGLADVGAEEGFVFTYRYTILAWNDAVVRAIVDNDDGDAFCRTREPHGSDHFFEGRNHAPPDAMVTTALASFPTFLSNPGFATGRQVAVLPRGFLFSWGGPGGDTDHHLLQLAYNLESVAPYVRNQDYYKASAMLNPLAGSPAQVAFGEFVSWKTSVIFKDNSRRHDFAFFEFVSALGGPDVEIIQPEFVVLPREDVDANIVGGGPGGGVKSAEILIEKLPYTYAVPILTCWEIGYTPPGEGDQHVKDFGIFMDRIHYERPPGATTGNLRYTITAVLADKDAFPDNYFSHKVTILGLKPTAIAAPPVGSVPGREQ
jgi:hypothetical protein